MKKIFASLLSVVALAVFSACSQSGGGTLPIATSTAVPLQKASAQPDSCNTVLCGDPTNGCPLATTRAHPDDLCGNLPGSGPGASYVPGGCATAYNGNGTPVTSCIPGYWTNPSGMCLVCMISPIGIVGGSGGTPVARRAPVPGAQCWGSPATLGDNVPPNTSGPNTEVNNIYVLMANNGTGNLDVIGWLYATRSGMWLQTNPTFPQFWGTIVQGVPGLGAFASALNQNGIANVGSSLGATIMSYMNGHKGYAASCFTSSLG